LEKHQILEEYLNYLEKAHRAPDWVYKFTDATKVTRENFYQHFEDINQLEQSIWLTQWDSTFEILSGDEAYTSYTVREKLLAVYFTLMQVLNERRSAFVKMLNRVIIPGTTPGFLKGFKQGITEHMESLVRQGIKAGEIETRPLISSYYVNALWLQCLFLLRIWKNDASGSQMALDEAVERAVNLVIDLMAYNPIDAGLGLTRFFYRNWRLLK
jgi:hypothetical protein